VATVNDWPATGPDDPLHRRAHQKVLRRVREFCLAKPQTAEKQSRGHIPVITVGGKNFCIFWRADGRPNVCFSTPPGMQQVLVREDPERYFVPAYMGVRGWVGIRLDVDVDWAALENVANESYSFAAPQPKASKTQRARSKRA
jgi:predicted DNA-binding protein (MmcQ/YjbR family)